MTNLPKVGEFLLGLKGDFYRKMVLGTSFIYDKGFITNSYFENVTRFHKIRGTTEVLLKILRKQFFGTLSDEIRRLGDMNVPILIVWGRHDKGIPLERGQEMHKILRGSRLEIFERVGHCPHDEQSQEFNQLALEFLLSS